MYLKTEMIGRLTKDPEISVIQKNGSDITLAKFTVACDIGFGDNKITEFCNCTAWNKTADAVGKVCVKGQLVHVVASPRTHKYEVDKNGTKVPMTAVDYNVETINFLSKGKGTAAEPADAVPANGKVPF